MDAVEPVGSHLARLLPAASATTWRRLEEGARVQPFRRGAVLQARGFRLPPFLVLRGHLMARRSAETGQTYGVLIAGPGYLGAALTVSKPDAEAGHELVALSDGAWATWDPQLVRELALEDAGLAVDLLDRAVDLTRVLSSRLDERSLETARQRLAAILTRYGRLIFDTPHPVARRDDLAAMIGTSRVMMYRALRELESEGLIKRERTGGIAILDEPRLERLVAVARLEGAPEL